jgi:hypothetical protein
MLNSAMAVVMVRRVPPAKEPSPPMAPDPPRRIGQLNKVHGDVP